MRESEAMRGEEWKMMRVDRLEIDWALGRPLP
jgi:hypothetical protein